MNNIILNTIIALVGINIFAPDSNNLTMLLVGFASIAVVRFLIHVMKGE